MITVIKRLVLVVGLLSDAAGVLFMLAAFRWLIFIPGIAGIFGFVVCAFLCWVSMWLAVVFIDTLYSTRLK